MESTNQNNTTETQSCKGGVSGSVFDIKSEVIFNGITYNQHIGFDGLLFYCKQIKK